MTPQNMSTSAKIRKDIKKIGEQYMNGALLKDIASKYKCSHNLVGRIMKQELPADFFAERERKRVTEEKAKMEGRKQRKPRMTK